MLTIKHIAPGGDESVIPVDRVHYDGRNRATADDHVGGRIYAYEPGGGIACEFFDGMVYVMNAKGNTVAKYDLGKWRHGESMRAQPMQPHDFAGQGVTGVAGEKLAA
jgi:hypothetical protein